MTYAVPIRGMRQVGSKKAVAQEPPHWAEAIRLRRSQLRRSQEEIAALSGDAIHQVKVSRVERGLIHPVEGLSLAELWGLIRALDWDMREFSAATGLDVPMPGLVPFDEDDTEEVDFWGTVSAGNGKSHAKPLGKMRWERDVVKRYRKYGLYTLEVDGTSMYSDDMPYSIPPGAKVLVARNLEPKPNDVVVVWLPERGHNGTGVLKAWRDERERGYVLLHSWNKDVAPIVLTDDEPNFCQGVVVGVHFNPRDLPPDLKKRASG